ncbi:MAG: RNA polymerase sigma factor [Kangiellaceae bacterium]|nr:RNA polymerase sigma factor [Kangiellaceae bacterium]
MHQAEEDLLVIAAQSGNQKAFQLLYSRYQQSLSRFAYKLCGDAEMAQDALQEAWFKTARSIRKIEDPRTFRSWIYRVVRWRCLDLMRQFSSKQKLYEMFDELEHSVSDSSAIEAAIEQSEELSAAIERMPALEKQMIHLFYMDELKITEIASVLNIPSGTVKSRLNRARQLLKQKFAL